MIIKYLSNLHALVSKFVSVSRISKRSIKFLSREMGPLESAKKVAAYRAVDEYVKNNTVIGIGSGSTVIYAIHRLAERQKEENLKVVCIPSSYQTRHLIISNNLPVGDLEAHPKIDCTIDGADEVDADMNLIKGGGGCLLLEKIVASCSEKFIIIADHTKNSQKFGDNYKKGIPIEVVPFAHVPIKLKIEEKFGGTAEIRMAKAKYGPIVTDNGNFILDWHFPLDVADWNKVYTDLLLIPGIVEIGLFMNMAEKAYFGMPDGTVVERSAT
ncbi:ribose-5-phosphate isomerase isoform X1 [Athalia rosae]|uniref:ribose-5-phosphate isomerase isoform X1 n=1 Tax=Athalia rosae TaxID=37344 RepID=UPI0020344CA5|nr:ribose-5-phosphate isomerase isoform X1 [Athalia rosae]